MARAYLPSGARVAHRHHLHTPGVVHILRLVESWAERHRQRRALEALEDFRLVDIGVSREQARREAAKPFWMI
jgi:uncharacterized protein YjiS (DUF1127 family)